MTAVPGIATYVATKHAVLGYTDTARLELRGTGVTLSTVMPTLTNTSMIDGDGQRARTARTPNPRTSRRESSRLIAKPKPRLAVTRAAGLLIGVAAAIHAPSRHEAINRALHFDTIFVEAADKQERRDYEDRARHS